MKLEGIHHVTAITADAPRNVDFYTRVLGMRLVKKTVNQDDPTVYHLFYADEDGSPGSDLTFFEYPGLPRGRAGAGMVHTVSFRVASEEALSFWVYRLGHEGIDSELDGLRLRFADPEGMGLELAVVETEDEPLVAVHPEIPAELALQGFDGVYAYATEPGVSRSFLEEALAFEPSGDASWEIRGEERGSFYRYDEPPAERGRSGAATVHHVAWASPLDEHEAWRERVAQAGARPTPVIDRFYFRSDLLPRAERRALRDRHARAGLHRRRAARDARRGALAAAGVRAPARAARARAHAASRPAAAADRQVTFRKLCA